MPSGSEFPNPGRKGWEEMAQKITKGEPADSALSTLTYDGISIRPLYDSSDLKNLKESRFAAPDSRFEVKDWEIRSFAVLGSKQCHLSAIQEAGAGGVWLRVPTRQSPKSLKSALKDSNLHLFFDSGPRCFETADAWLQAFSKDKPSINTGVSLNIDPLGVLMEYGELDRTPEKALEDLAGYVDLASSFASREVIPIGVSGAAYANAGATEAEQAAFVLATAVNYLRAMESSGADISDSAASIEFTLAVSTEMFATIAFLRAFRICWQNVLQSIGAKPQRARLHCVSSTIDITATDKWTNLLRATAGCFGAALGGADSITILPLDYASGQTSEASSRLALNASHILKQESQITRIKDPVRGSYYLESLTADFAKACWQRFQEIEDYGSMLKLVCSGKANEIVQNSWDRIKQDIESSKLLLIGVNEFLNPEESSRPLASSSQNADQSESSQSLNQILPLKNPAFQIEPLQRRGVEEAAYQAANNADSADSAVGKDSKNEPEGRTK